ncbi:galectin-4 isoform X2 [Latimeria chalumnae]|uniref:galectin-4 isoform X2 n=1 Tax=Latimeria chalumnae TaxID=7897 RepID=UPI0006D8DD3A|nr:PREDICTED: galectin-4 [Latimeria chalumnae]|eukprot:XP_014349223.1 PREDICTED: galectin-4 [Latimeria chalumnae]
MAFVPPPGYQPIYNPSIPYSGPIFGGVRPGMSIYVQGYIPQDTNRFNINFACGQEEGSDIAFHFNPRFDGWDKVVFNSFQNNEWGDEEHKRDMPFSLDQNFELVFIVTPDYYQVNVNGQSYYQFNHRIPLERVEALQVAGNVMIQSINISGSRMAPGYEGGYGGGVGGGYGGGYGGGVGGGYGGGYGGGMGGEALPVPSFPSGNLPPVPYATSIQGGLFPKRTIIVRGFVPQGADRFHINLKASCNNDIALHINPRVSEGIVVRNSFLNGTWGEEERDLETNPFQPGQYFDLSVRCGNYRFKVFINGQPLFVYNHRLRPFEQVDTVEIEGDVAVSYVHV